MYCSQDSTGTLVIWWREERSWLGQIVPPHQCAFRLVYNLATLAPSPPLKGGILVASMFSSVCLAQIGTAKQTAFLRWQVKASCPPSNEAKPPVSFCLHYSPRKSWACSCRVLKTVNFVKRLSRASNSSLKSFQLGLG